MKLLAFSDIHGDSDAIEKLKKKAKEEKADAFVCAGDISFFGSNLSFIIKSFNIGIPLIIVPGNHETNFQLNSSKEKFMHNIHQKSLKIGSVLFLGCGGSSFTPFNTPFEMSEKEFANAISKLKTQDHQMKIVLLTHEPPYNTKLDFLVEHAGSKSIRKFIDKHQPDYNICGHFHENEGMKDKVGRTIIINPGPKGRIIEI